MTPKQFQHYGQVLYGYGWQPALGKALGVSDRSIRKWAAGDAPIPQWARDALPDIKEQRIAELRAI